MKLLLLALVANLGSTRAASSCACEAEELGFALDCAATGTMLDSLAFLKTNGCAAACTSASCVEHYYVVQAHHDYCPEADIPEAVEDGFHDYDAACTPCEIHRAFTVGAPDCPAATCDDGSGNAAYTAMVEAGCGQDCSSQACRDNFLTLRIVHDDCEHDALSRASEEGLHDMERPCKDVLCNAADGGDDQTVCVADPHAGHDHGDGAYEWAGVFALADDAHVWTMQQVGGAYADPTMRLVLIPADPPTAATLEALEERGEALIEGEDCTVVEDGEEMNPAGAGACFELHVNGAAADSTFRIATSGIKGLAVFAQHFPTEFERDQHYLKDSAGTDIEPVHEEGGGGHEGHGHGEEGDGTTSGAGVVSAVAALIGAALTLVA